MAGGRTGEHDVDLVLLRGQEVLDHRRVVEHHQIGPGAGDHFAVVVAAVDAPEAVAAGGVEQAPGRQGRRQAGAVVQTPREAQIAEEVLVVVVRAAVEAESEPQAVAHETPDRRHAGAHPQIARGVDGHRDAALGHQGALLVGEMHAVGHGEPRRQQADVVQEAHNPLPVGRVQPLALAPRLQQVHVHAAVVRGRRLCDALQGGVPTPLRTDGAVLHLEQLALVGRRDDFDLLDQTVRRRVVGEGGLDSSPVGRGQVRQQGALIAVDPGVAVADRAGEGHPDPHLGRGEGDPCRLGLQVVRDQRVVAVHRRADAGERHAAERDRGLQPGLDGDPGQRRDPALQRVVGAAEPPAVVPRSRGRGR